MSWSSSTPGEARTYDLEIGALDGLDEIDAFGADAARSATGSGEASDA